MGMYDTVHIYQRCPYCGMFQQFDAQTKDIGSCMYTYGTLYEGKDIIDRRKFPVFKQYPKDKSAKVWKNQVEECEASATIPKQYHNLKFIKVIADCHSEKCQMFADLMTGYHSGFGRSFEGKIKVKNGKLKGEIYDIEK